MTEKRAASGPVTDLEREYVRSKFPQMSVAEIAKNLDRSRVCINNIVKKEGLRESCKQDTFTTTVYTEVPESTLTRLRELRDMLRESLLKAAPKEMPGIAREYRATVELIERMEGGCEDNAESALDTIAQSIANRMST